MKYFEHINKAMLGFAKAEDTVFLGYNIARGSRGYKTFEGINQKKLIEMPCAEQSMLGIATGMAVAGYIPIVFFERHDFLLLAADQIINHLAKIDDLSNGDFKPKVIIRAVVGHDKPFDPGPQHMGDYYHVFKDYLPTFQVMPKYSPNHRPGEIAIEDAYDTAMAMDGPVMLVEYKEYYNREVS